MSFALDKESRKQGGQENLQKCCEESEKLNSRPDLSRIPFFLDSLKDEETIMEQNWPFDQAENVAAITTRQIIEEGKPILMVIHYSDDQSWAFLCNTTGDKADGRVIGMGEALKLDPTLQTIANLPPGWIGVRTSVGERWTMERSTEH